MNDSRFSPLRFPLVVLACAVGFVTALSCVLLMRWVSPPPTLAVVQIDRVLAEHVATVARQNWDEARQQEEVRRFAAALEASLTELSDDGRVILLSGPAVIRGAPDWTPALQARLTQALGPMPTGKVP